jgi:hypothetical protein
MYGMIGTLPDRKEADGFLVDFLDGVFDRG